MRENDREWVTRAAEAGLELGTEAWGLLQKHVDLVQEANRTCSLVSEGDLSDLWGRHVVDSLSLAAVIKRDGRNHGLLLDIGSGGGFPAIPLRVALPDLRLVLVERSERKVGFLRRVVAALRLDRIEIVLGEFPRAAQGFAPDWITARAVEKPEKVVRQVLEALPAGTTFLCQSGHGEAWNRERFHVERIEDRWTALHLRRGTLELVRHRT